MSQQKLLSLSTVCEMTSYSKPHIYKLMALDEFPHQIKIGLGNRVAWLESEITAYIEEQIAASRGRADAA